MMPTWLFHSALAHRKEEMQFTKTKRFVISVLALVACLAVVSFLAYDKLYSAPAPVELTKDEAVNLVILQVAAEHSIATVNGRVTQLYGKYGLSQTEYRLDVAGGRFVPLVKPEAEKPVEQPGLKK